MRSPILVLPPPAELRALRFLHENGPSTIREYWERSGLREERRAYTTALAMFQLMYRKKRVTRSKDNGIHRYSPVGSRQQLCEKALAYVLEHVFGGSVEEMKAMLEKSPRRKK